MIMARDKMICAKCNEEMKTRKWNLTYVGYQLSYDFLTCPKCNAIYIPKDLVEGRIREVEISLEDK